MRTTYTAPFTVQFESLSFNVAAASARLQKMLKKPPFEKGADSTLPSRGGNNSLILYVFRNTAQAARHNRSL